MNSRHDVRYLIRQGEVPQVYLDGRKLAIVSCSYHWTTDTDEAGGNELLIVDGYHSTIGKLVQVSIAIDQKHDEVFVQENPVDISR